MQGERAQILPGTGRWQAEADGGAAAFNVRYVERGPLHHRLGRRSPSPFREE
jgi:hypothetical protein